MKTLKLIRCVPSAEPLSGNRASSTTTALRLVKSTPSVSRTMGRGLETIIPIIAKKLEEMS